MESSQEPQAPDHILINAQGSAYSANHVFIYQQCQGSRYIGLRILDIRNPDDPQYCHSSTSLYTHQCTRLLLFGQSCIYISTTNREVDR